MNWFYSRLSKETSTPLVSCFSLCLFLIKEGIWKTLFFLSFIFSLRFVFFFLESLLRERINSLFFFSTDFLTMLIWLVEKSNNFYFSFMTLNSVSLNFSERSFILLGLLVLFNQLSPCSFYPCKWIWIWLWLKLFEKLSYRWTFSFFSFVFGEVTLFFPLGLQLWFADLVFEPFSFWSLLLMLILYTMELILINLFLPLESEERLLFLDKFSLFACLERGDYLLVFSYKF